MDGAAAGNPGKAGAGGLLRDEMAWWEGGFLANIGTASNIIAELRALLKGERL